MDEPQTQGAVPPKKNEGTDEHSEGPSLWQRPVTIIIGTIVIAALLVWAGGKVAKGFSHESTDDAFLSADIVSVSPKVSGEVVQVFVNDNQMVKAGDPLVQIDPRDFETAMAQKNAALTAANANTNVIQSS